jgi:hypothetical protein
VDERIGLFLHIAGAACGFGLLGAVFGALAAARFHAGGKSPGGVFGPRLLRLWERGLGRELAPATRAAASGAIDGAVFLAVIGAGVGLWGHQSGQGPGWVLRVGAGAALLAVGAVLFGVIAYFLVGVGVRASGPVLMGAMAGGVIGACCGAETASGLASLLGVRLTGSDPMFVALVGGAVLGGALGAWIALAGRPAPQPPPDDDLS